MPLNSTYRMIQVNRYHNNNNLIPKIIRPAEFGVGKDRAHQALSRIERCWESGKSCSSRNIEQQSLPTTAPPPLHLTHPYTTPPPSSPSFNSSPHTALAVDEVLSQCCPVSRPGLLPRPELFDSPPRSPGAMSPPMLPAPTSRRARFPPRTTSPSPSASPMSPSRPTRWTRPHTNSTPPRRS